MNKVEVKDVMNILEYEKVREEFRDRIIELKKNRRVAVGDMVTFLFENRDTVLFQIQEMVRAERIVEERKIQDEIDVYSELLPRPGQLSATMFIEIEEQSAIKPTLERLIGITRTGVVRMEIGSGARVDADFEQGREEEAAGKLAAVQYTKFKFGEEELQELRHATTLSLVIDHPNYQARTVLDGWTVLELLTDLEMEK